MNGKSITFSIVIVLLVGGIGYFAYQQFQPTPTVEEVVEEITKPEQQFEVQQPTEAIKLEQQPEVEQPEVTEEITELVQQLKIGQTMEFNNIKLTLVTVVEDSRCPIDVDCIWAGRIKLEVQLQSNTETVNEVLASEDGNVSDDDNLVYNGHSIKITNILPEPISTERLSDDDYLITVKVIKL